MLKTAFETGRLGPDAYVRKTFFHRERSFTPEDFKRVHVRPVAAPGRDPGMGPRPGPVRPLPPVHAEQRVAGAARVPRARLRARHDLPGLPDLLLPRQAKPDEGIYLNALGIAACDRDDAIFIDDRALNVEPALALGLKAVQFQDLDQLRDFLERGIVA